MGRLESMNVYTGLIIRYARELWMYNESEHLERVRSVRRKIKYSERANAAKNFHLLKNKRHHREKEICSKIGFVDTEEIISTYALP